MHIMLCDGLLLPSPKNNERGIRLLCPFETLAPIGAQICVWRVPLLKKELDAYVHPLIVQARQTSRAPKVHHWNQHGLFRHKARQAQRRLKFLDIWSAAEVPKLQMLS
jgi:hypothetical protein